MAEAESEVKSGKSSPRLLRAMFLVVLLIASGYFLLKFLDGTEERDVNSTEFDELVITLRENRNRLEVYRLSGTITTKAGVFGGVGDILRGEMTVRQPGSISYFTNMADLTLDDYIWDEKTRTLIVRAPEVKPDVPNIDESKQVVVYKGPIITRDMQTRLRSSVATKAKKQVSDEAAKPENMTAAAQAARAAIASNLEAPLRATGLRNVSVVVRTAHDSRGVDKGRWDVSRSIAEVLAERAAR